MFAGNRRLAAQVVLFCVKAGDLGGQVFGFDGDGRQKVGQRPIFRDSQFSLHLQRRVASKKRLVAFTAQPREPFAVHTPLIDDA